MLFVKGVSCLSIIDCFEAGDDYFQRPSLFLSLVTTPRDSEQGQVGLDTCHGTCPYSVQCRVVSTQCLGFRLVDLFFVNTTT